MKLFHYAASLSSRSQPLKRVFADRDKTMKEVFGLERSK